MSDSFLSERGPKPLTFGHCTQAGHDERGRAARVMSLGTRSPDFAMALEQRLRAIRDAEPAKVCRLLWVQREVDEEEGCLRVEAGYEEVYDPQTVADLVLRHGALPIELFAPIASQVLGALAGVHGRSVAVGTVHPRDLLLRTQSGRALALRIRDLGWPQQPPATSGSAAEHLRPPEGPAVTTASDVYSLGKLFVWMLEGRWGVDAREMSPSVPLAVRELLSGMTAEDPEARPATVDDVIERLVDGVPARLFALPRETSLRLPIDRGWECAASGSAVAAERRTAVFEPPPVRARGRTTAGMLVGALAAAVVLSTAWLWRAGPPAGIAEVGAEQDPVGEAAAAAPSPADRPVAVGAPALSVTAGVHATRDHDRVGEAPRKHRSRAHAKAGASSDVRRLSPGSRKSSRRKRSATRSAARLRAPARTHVVEAAEDGAMVEAKTVRDPVPAASKKVERPNRLLSPKVRTVPSTNSPFLPPTR